MAFNEWMFVYNARGLNNDQILQTRVNRVSEVQACIRCLRERGENAFVWGARGVGKTFLLRLIASELSTDATILPVWVDVFATARVGSPAPSTAFPESVLLATCAEIWRSLIKKPYSSLRACLDLREGDIRRRSPLEKVVETVYSRVMSSQRKAHYQYENSVGFSAGAKGEKKETGWVEQEQPPIMPFEFLEFSNELARALIDVGKERVIATCDEANLLPIDEQAALLSHYLDLFNARGTQFLFVAGTLPGDSEPPPIPDGFDLVLPLQGLAPEACAELLQKQASSLGYRIAEPAFAIAAEQTKGNPRLLLSLIPSVVEQNPTSIDIDLASIEKACSQQDRKLRGNQAQLPRQRRQTRHG